MTEPAAGNAAGSKEPDAANAAAAAAAAKEAKRARKVWWFSHVGYWAVQALARSWRIEVRGDEHWPRENGRRKTAVVSVWHGQMFAPIWVHRGRGIVAMASEHGDGEIIARILERIGYGRPARGSSTKGGARALLTMVNLLRGGTTLAFTPDGPRGPARVAQPGLFVAARKAQTVIIPVSTYAARAWHTKSWDRFEIPKPFARVRVSIGQPFEPRFDGDVLAAGEMERFAAAMDAAEALARA